MRDRGRYAPYMDLNKIIFYMLVVPVLLCVCCGSRRGVPVLAIFLDFCSSSWPRSWLRSAVLLARGSVFSDIGLLFRFVHLGFSLIPLVRLYSSSSLFVLCDEVRPSQLIPVAVRPLRAHFPTKSFTRLDFSTALVRAPSPLFSRVDPVLFSCRWSLLLLNVLFCSALGSSPVEGIVILSPIFSAFVVFDLGQPARAEAAPKG
jgi:hypothetical protein